MVKGIETETTELRGDTKKHTKYIYRIISDTIITKRIEN